ncbi:fatty acid hydroxylase [Flagelloscypha sp. PMI_526]|nr:fatty acid hydroxylase [Flagelloscypha sp. PMI_526]
MDLVLELADSLLLDTVYARLMPVSLFNSPTNGSASAFPVFDSKWSQLISRVPHPPIVDVLSEYTTNDGALSFSQDAISVWPRDYIPRQIVSLVAITMIGIHLLYFIFAGFSYYFIFNHDMMRHPRYLKNQVKLEIQSSLAAFPLLLALMFPSFFGEVRGYSRLYGGEVQGVWEWTYLVLSVPFFLVFTDYCVYWIHRWLHLPFLYKRLHKPHHKWLVPTPFASHAFHPVDGFAQALPYHIYAYIFPMHRVLYLALFVAVNCWTIFIHDSDMVTGHPLEEVINGPAHHTLHHLYFTVNYGQYFTWADRWGGSYRQPDKSLDPMLEVIAADKKAAELAKSKAE